MGRPREFDREQALEMAMQTFWELGYEGASTAILEQRMGIGRSSFYASFGSKDALYAEAMERYRSDLRRRIVEPLGAEGPADRVLERFFRSVADRDPQSRACMVVRAAVSGMTDDPTIASTVREVLSDLDEAFLALLQRGVEQGRLRVDGDTRAQARMLTSLFQSLNVAIRAGRSRRELRQIVGEALRPLSP